VIIINCLELMQDNRIVISIELHAAKEAPFAMQSHGLDHPPTRNLGNGQAIGKRASLIIKFRNVLSSPPPRSPIQYPPALGPDQVDPRQAF
jgi:hypothetical protein